MNIFTNIPCRVYVTKKLVELVQKQISRSDGAFIYYGAYSTIATLTLLNTIVFARLVYSDVIKHHAGVSTRLKAIDDQVDGYISQHANRWNLDLYPY